MHLNLAYFEDFMNVNAILISGDGEGLQELAHRLRNLEVAGAEPLELHALPFVETHGNVRLVAFPVDAERGILRDKAAKSEPWFTWHHSTEGWLEAAEKIEAVAQGIGHAYLDGLVPEDATVIVSSEYGVHWWQEHGPVD